MVPSCSGGRPTARWELLFDALQEVRACHDRCRQGAPMRAYKSRDGRGGTATGATHARLGIPANLAVRRGPILTGARRIPTKIRPAPTKIRPAPTKIRPAPTKIRPDPTRIRPATTGTRPATTKIRSAPTGARPDPA